MIDEHMKLFRTTDMDIIKIMQDYPYPISGKITCADDWYHIQVKGTDSEEFAKMAEIIRGIRKEDMSHPVTGNEVKNERQVTCRYPWWYRNGRTEIYLPFGESSMV